MDAGCIALSFVDFTAPVAIPDLFSDKKEDYSHPQHYGPDIICRGEQITEKPWRLVKIYRKAMQGHKKRSEND